MIPLNLKKKVVVFVIMILTISFSGCGNRDEGKEDKLLKVFHAGSLSVPFQKISEEFIKLYPGTEIHLEAAGSVTCVRKITDLDRECDLIALADYYLIDRFLIPDHATWGIKFASNEMCVAYNSDSQHADIVNSGNFIDIISSDDVSFGRSNPDSDPCGYRSVLVLMLADKLYTDGVDVDRLLKKDNRFIRPKETDLLALLETGNLDYIFIYKSVAVQHKLKFIELPDSINLGNPALAEWYSGAALEISGSEPGQTIEIRGEPMVYGLSIPSKSPNPELARTFAEFILNRDGGLRILNEEGQSAVDITFTSASIDTSGISVVR